MNILKILGVIGLKEYKILKQDRDEIMSELIKTNKNLANLKKQYEIDKNTNSNLFEANKKLQEKVKKLESHNDFIRDLNHQLDVAEAKIKEQKNKIEDVTDMLELKIRDCESLKDKVERLEKSSNTAKGGYQREINKWKHKYLYALKVLFKEGLPNVEWQKKDVEIFLKQELNKMKEWDEKHKGVAR